MAINVVELVANRDECAFDQPCKFGHRVEGHAVYCHNDAWVDGPRKCRRTWYTGGDVRDEDCPGFQPNPEFNGEIATPALIGPPCSGCGGVKLVKADPARGTVETCDLCQGDGVQPAELTLSDVEVYVLEVCLSCHFSHPFDHDTAIVSGEPFRLKEFPRRLLDENLLSVRSVGWDGPATVNVVRLTHKGYAILRQNWDRKRKDRGEA